MHDGWQEVGRVIARYPPDSEESETRGFADTLSAPPDGTSLTAYSEAREGSARKPEHRRGFQWWRRAESNRRHADFQS